PMMPVTRQPSAKAVRTTARMHAFIPGASPPLVRTPICLSSVPLISRSSGAAASSVRKVLLSKPQRHLGVRGLRRVRSVHQVLLSAGGEVAPDGARGGLLRPQCAHHVSNQTDRILALPD